jgi:hypothetical protein
METTKSPARRIGLIAVVGVLALAFVPVALAGKVGNTSGGVKHGGGGGGGGTLSLVMVMDANGDGLPNWGDTVTFNVSTTATTEPHVDLTCSKNGVVVYGATTASTRATRGRGHRR